MDARSLREAGKTTAAGSRSGANRTIRLVCGVSELLANRRGGGGNTGSGFPSRNQSAKPACRRDALSSPEEFAFS